MGHARFPSCGAQGVSGGAGAEALSQAAEAAPEGRGGEPEPEPEPGPEPGPLGRGGSMAGPRQVQEAGGEARE